MTSPRTPIPGPDGRLKDKHLPSRLEKTALDASYARVWQANTAYPAGTPAILPDGRTGTAKTTFTSGAAFSAANWNIVATGGSGGASLTKDATTGMYVIGSGSSLTKDATTGMYQIGA